MLLSSVPVALGLLFTASEALAMPVNNAGGMSETIAKRNVSHTKHMTGFALMTEQCIGRRSGYRTSRVHCL